MALETIEGLPEEVASLYKKGEDGKFHLEGSDGLKSALQKERERANTAERALKERETSEARAAQAAKEAADLAAGNFEKVNAAREAALKAAQEELQKTHLAHETHLKQTKALTLLGPLAVNEVALEDLSRRFIEQLEVVEGNVLVKGNPALTPEKLAESFRSDPKFGNYLKGDGVSGGGAPPAGGKGVGNAFKDMTKTQLAQALNNPATKAAAEAYLAKA